MPDRELPQLILFSISFSLKVKSIYNMMGPNHVSMDQFESPEARAEGIFRRMDVNSDGKVTRQEFVRCCLEDQKLIELLTPHTLNQS